MKRVEVWRWRYRDEWTGSVCTSLVPMTEDEASLILPEAERINGSLAFAQEDRLHSDEFLPPSDADGECVGRTQCSTNGARDQADTALATRKLGRHIGEAGRLHQDDR